MNKDFSEALGNFVLDFSSRGAVCHLVDLGFTIDEIEQRLDYPISKENIARIAFQHYLDQGSICLSQPNGYIEKVKYVKEQNSFGKISIRKVVEKEENTNSDYIKCDYGKQLYQFKRIEDYGQVSKKYMEHVAQLPWPLEDVWVKRDLFK